MPLKTGLNFNNSRQVYLLYFIVWKFLISSDVITTSDSKFQVFISPGGYIILFNFRTFNQIYSKATKAMGTVYFWSKIAI
jgi:hypothetical protein